MKSIYDTLAPEDRADSHIPDEIDTADLPVTTDGHQLALDLLSTPQYRRSLLRRIVMGELHPSIEAKLWDHAYGKPADKLEFEDKTVKPTDMTIEQILSRTEKVQKMARELIKKKELEESKTEGVH
jgi:hypothetical protein